MGEPYGVSSIPVVSFNHFKVMTTYKYATKGKKKQNKTKKK